MTKKSIIIVVIIVIILALGFVAYKEFFNNNSNVNSSDAKSVQVGSINYNLPSGYHLESSDGNLSANISDGSNSLHLNVLNDDNVTKQFEDYKAEKLANNKSVTLTKFTVKDTLVYRSNIVNDTGFIHYWFAYNKKVYSISTWNGNNETDNVVSNLISSSI